MRQDIITEAISQKRVKGAVGTVDCPVTPQFLRAEHQYPLVLQLKELDNCQSGKCLAETDAVRQDTAVTGENLINGCFGAVLLERKQLLPNMGVRKCRSTKRFINVTRTVEIVTEEIEKGQIIDELW